jgi:hypothetical protein
MITFKEYLTEAKNTHMTHLEDLVLYAGVNGVRNAINTIRDVRNSLYYSLESDTSVNLKVDGAPAVFAGIDPTDGQFFVAKKGIFNKNPKVYKSEADVRADTSGDLADKLSIAYNELKKLGIKNIIQGDIMFTAPDVKTETINDEKVYTFQANTIVYTVPVDSDLGKKIKSANIGVVFHTTYSGDSFEGLNASFGVDLGSLKTPSSVWYTDPNFDNATAAATFTKADYDEITTNLSEAGKIFKQISSGVLKQIEGNPELAQKLEQFNNTLVRKGERIADTKAHVANLIKWFNDNFQKEIDKRSSEKGKATQIEKRDEFMKFFSDSNKKNLKLIYDLQNALIDAKLILIKKLDQMQNFKTFVKTKKGYRVTGQEGFVAIRNGAAVKLVDRLEFSYTNFSDEILKAWQK